MIGQKKCGNCTRKGLACDGHDVTVHQFEKLDKERDRLLSEIKKSRAAMREAMSRMERFERLKETLESREAELIRRGVENMEDLERMEEEDRVKATGSPRPSSNPPDAITMLEDFSAEMPESEWQAFLSAPLAATSEEVSHS